MGIRTMPVLAGAALAVATLLSNSALNAQPPGQTNLVVNGSFEQGPNPGSYVNLAGGVSSIAGWVVSGEGIDYIGNLWVASDGLRSIDLDGSARSRTTPPYSRGGVAQTFATTPGASYAVSFDLAGNPFGGPPVKPLRVSAAGQSMDFEFAIAGKNARNMGWVRKSWTFTANATATTLEISSLTVSPQTGWGAVIDNVVVSQLDPLPNPRTGFRADRLLRLSTPGWRLRPSPRRPSAKPRPRFDPDSRR